MTPEKAIEVYPKHSKNRLKKMRTSKGLSQQGLANASEVAARVIRAYEQGERDVDKAMLETICDLCIALDCKIDDILEDVNLRSKFKQVK